MTVLLIAGIGVILAGLAAVGFGIPVKEFGFGNTLILTGSVGVCTGLIMISLGIVVREIKKLVPLPGSVEAMPRMPRRELNLTPPVDDAEEDEEPAPRPNPLFDREVPPVPRPAAPDSGAPPWQDDVLRDRERLAAAASGASEEPKRRNLMFSSTRRERAKEQSEAAVAQALQLDLDAPEPTPAADETRAREPGNFDNAWPQSDRPRTDRPQPDRPRFSDAIRQAARASTTHEADHLPDLNDIPDREPPAAAPPERPAGVTVLKSGVVDGMAYSLYSDGSIEAQMPEGLMRFASIDDLREHLDNRN
ncbi:hypothetical protein RPMA_10710 [Tardiphaga alba]|uniref:DUF308 domain-containing protein n=1 Tax=Tardiphaga alba TaxID=340268 RepID=A0ABX8A735_9BRAD|nr:hypothetical protein [Tardiphaga alba]QUS39257.1 hypothetical protein RPMA_10710 [Tardiphaga alba]